MGSAESKIYLETHSLQEMVAEYCIPTMELLRVAHRDLRRILQRIQDLELRLAMESEEEKS